MAGARGCGKGAEARVYLALVTFGDGCNNFYWYRTFFLAAAGIAEFRNCNFANKIVEQIVKWGFGDSSNNVRGYYWRQRFRQQIQKAAREALKQTDCLKAIDELINVMELSKEEDITGLKEAADYLEQMGKGNPRAIINLIHMLENTQRKLSRWRIAETLGKIDPGNERAIDTLIHLINDPSVTRADLIANSLGEVGMGNERAIATLSHLLEISHDSHESFVIAKALVKIDPTNEQALRTLGNWYYSIETYDGCRIIRSELGEAYRQLGDLLSNAQDEDIRCQVIENLRTLSINKEKSSARITCGLVSVLRKYLTNQVYKIDSKLYEACYDTIWHIAQHLPYPDFYQAWHQTSIHERRRI